MSAPLSSLARCVINSPSDQDSVSYKHCFNLFKVFLEFFALRHGIRSSLSLDYLIFIGGGTDRQMTSKLPW
jgi:hypothetical protein